MPPVVLSASYDANNQQTSFGDTTMTYDNNGSLSTEDNPIGTTVYTWNARNQLVAVTAPGLAATFGYDALARRRTKTLNGSRVDYLHDKLNTVQEGILPGTPTVNLLTGPGVDDYLSRTDLAGTSHFLRDVIGSTVALTDALGAVSTEYTYDPFGASSSAGVPSANVYQFTGRESDGAGRYYYRARYYQPTLHRFMSEDPPFRRAGLIFDSLALQCAVSGDGMLPANAARLLLQATNLYSYAGNSPVNAVDPTGEGIDLPFPLPIPGLPLVLNCLQCAWYMPKCVEKGLACKESKTAGGAIVTSAELIKDCYAKIPECSDKLKYCTQCAAYGGMGRTPGAGKTPVPGDP
jgi:RHS repeat-associated protein